jgi:hypothetical protein
MYIYIIYHNFVLICFDVCVCVSRVQLLETALEASDGTKAELGAVKEKARASSIQNKQFVKEINLLREKYEKANVIYVSHKYVENFFLFKKKMYQYT